MARKPKNTIQEEVSPPTSVESSEIIIDTTDTPTVSVYSKPSEQTYLKIDTFDCEQRIYDEMPWALKEIERCNDYIYAKADLDRRFSTYRDELYEYRYKMRQLKFLPDFPNIDESRFPTRPDYVNDE